MPEAEIVAGTRSPIGKASKGSLKDLRPDDLAATIVRAALAQVPELDPADLDLLLGCGLPGGEHGFNMARVVAVLLGHDGLPGTAVTRYCAGEPGRSRSDHDVQDRDLTTGLATMCVRQGQGVAVVVERMS